MVDKNQVTIYVPLTGGLGNQLFQYSAALSLNPQNIVLIENIGNPRLNRSGSPEILGLDLPQLVSSIKIKSKFLFLGKKVYGYLLRSGTSPGFLQKNCYTQNIFHFIANFVFTYLLKDRIRIHQSIDVGFDKIKSNSNFLIGYFQSYKYSNNPQVLASISSSVQRRICENPEWIRQMKSSNTLLVHVRLTDYLNEKSIGALEESYFRDAINFVLLSKPIKKIVLFSDDIERAKSAIPDDIDCVVHIYDDKFRDSTQVLAAMSIIPLKIISNSSFGWWASRIGNQYENLVFAPNPWFRELEDPRYLIPDNWETFPADFRERYTDFM